MPFHHFFSSFRKQTRIPQQKEKRGLANLTIYNKLICLTHKPIPIQLFQLLQRDKTHIKDCTTFFNKMEMTIKLLNNNFVSHFKTKHRINMLIDPENKTRISNQLPREIINQPPIKFTENRTQILIRTSNP